MGDLTELVPYEFQSTLPVRGATQHSHTALAGRDISIHAPREGSDRRRRHGAGGPHYFNLRSP